MPRKPVLAAFIIGLAGCEPPSDSEQATAPAIVASPTSSPATPAGPTNYYVRKVDLYREVPDDVCRTKDPKFIEGLVGRVIRSMPPDKIGDAQFSDFNAHRAFNGQGMEATIRFTIGSEAEWISAVGPFDPSTCAVGKMTARTGADGSDRGARILFTVPAPGSVS